MNLDVLEKALGEKKLTVGEVIEKLKSVEPVMLVNLKIGAKTHPHLNQIMDGVELWRNQVEFLENKVGFHLDSYLDLYGSDYRIFIYALADNIQVFNAAINMLESNPSFKHEDWWHELMAELMFYIAENGMIGLILELDYGQILLTEAYHNIGLR